MRALPKYSNMAEIRRTQGLPGLHAYIQKLVEQGELELLAEESTCPLDKVKTEDGWADEIMVHTLRCGHCEQIFTCVVNTWRGSGHFKKGKG